MVSHANYSPRLYKEQNLPSATGPATATSRLPGNQVKPWVSCQLFWGGHWPLGDEVGGDPGGQQDPSLAARLGPLSWERLRLGLCQGSLSLGLRLLHGTGVPRLCPGKVLCEFFLGDCLFS